MQKCFAYALLLITLVELSVAKSPLLKQGGDACMPQPNYCMNGGTCYTQITIAPVATTDYFSKHFWRLTTTRRTHTDQVFCLKQPNGPL